jgi:outer membrane protein OmpA-like peptidoglycan-associated protein
MAFHRLLTLFAAALLAAGSASVPVIAQQQQNAGDIANALAPKNKVTTRGLTIDPKASQDRQFLNGLRTRGVARSITVEERAKVAEIAQTKPAVDLEVNFEYNSAVIGAKAKEDLTKLGVALRDPRLKDQVVLVAGHTDAKGADAYNQDLSEKRADAVKQFLASTFSVPAENIVAVGYGRERLKNASSPYAPENRRVQVVNMSSQ